MINLKYQEFTHKKFIVHYLAETLKSGLLTSHIVKT